VTKDVENNRSDRDSRKGDGVDNKHNVVSNRSSQLHYILSHKHNFKDEHLEEKKHKQRVQKATNAPLSTSTRCRK
jgi:hypothetical protein